MTTFLAITEVHAGILSSRRHAKNFSATEISFAEFCQNFPTRGSKCHFVYIQKWRAHPDMNSAHSKGKECTRKSLLLEISSISTAHWISVQSAHCFSHLLATRRSFLWEPILCNASSPILLFFPVFCWQFLQPVIMASKWLLVQRQRQFVVVGGVEKHLVCMPSKWRKVKSA